MKTRSALVVGGGIVGAACARELARAGLKVTLFEAGRTSGGATGAGMGHIVVLGDTPALLRLTRFSQELWDAEELPREAERERCGTMWIARSEEQLAGLEAQAGTYGDLGVSTELLDESRLREAEPDLAPGLVGGLRVPGDSVIYPPVATARFLAGAEQAGATIRTGVPVQAIEENGIRLADGERCEADWIVNATGERALTLLPESPTLRIEPRKGHLAITDRSPGLCRHQLIEASYVRSTDPGVSQTVAFNVQPRATGQYLIGSSREFGVSDDGVDASVLAAMLARAIEFLPALADVPVVRTWCGFRAATPDKLPLIGPVPGRERVLLAAGHEGLGITTSLATARLVTDRILDREPAIDPTPYLPARTGAAHA